MKAFISHYTALRYWREYFPLDSELGLPTRVSGTEKCASCKIDVFGSIPEGFADAERPADVLIFNEGERRQSRSVKCYAWKTVLPSNAFFNARGMYVSSPEFVFVQMANELTVAQLVALGCELCGTYVLLPKGVTHPGALDELPKRISPLTSVSKLSTFVEALGKANGKTKAKRALKYVVDGSRSPMETMLYMLLCLPPLLGGYGIPQPVMNAEIELDDEARAMALRHTCYGDLCWPDARPPLDIEYHGEVHVGSAHMKSDVGRELAIEHMGWRVVTITSPQVFDPERFDTVARDVASAVRKRLSNPSPKDLLNRGALRHELKQWMFDAPR